MQKSEFRVQNWWLLESYLSLFPLPIPLQFLTFPYSFLIRRNKLPHQGKTRYNGENILFMDLRQYFAQNALASDDLVINNLGYASLATTTVVPQEIPFSPSLPRRLWHVGKSLSRFVITTCLIFGVIQISINYPAYKQQYDFFREKQLSIKDPQKEILKSLQKAPVNDSISTTQVAEAATSNSVEESFGTRQEVINYNNFELSPSDNRIVIGKIGKNVPVVNVPETKLVNGDYAGLEKDIQATLLKGIVHYPGTASPGEIGNTFFTGHSSNYVWIKSAYNDVFALLEEMVVGDKVTVYWQGKKFIYQVYDIKVVSPSETWVLQQSGNEYPSIMTLMTCTPVGTSLKRLIIRSKQIYPDPSTNRSPNSSVIASPTNLVSS